MSKRKATLWPMKLPVLCINHVTESTMGRLHATAKRPASYRPVATSVPYQEGFFIRFWDESHDHSEIEMPADLAAIKAWAADRKFKDMWVRLDADGDVVPELPTYDW